MISLSDFGQEKPKLAMKLTAIFSVLIIALIALPSIFPAQFPFLHAVTIDTDPENMLPPDEPVRVFHNEMKKEFALYDIIVVGVTNEVHPEGVFNTQSLKNIYDLAEHSKQIHWDEDGKTIGVISADLMAPSTVDNIEQAGLGTVRFEWLMEEPPGSEEEAVAIREKAKNLPMLNGTIVSDKGNALAIYIPITSKNVSYQVASKIKEKIDTFTGDDNFYITGLPIAQDTFGVEMFKQMALSAPMAMLLIFLLMLYFFRKPSLIISPLLVAMVSVIFTMGLLIITGNTIHIMSSMIPIFIMPIAVLDAVHILSDFFDRYQETKDRKATMTAVMKELSAPMFYTTLTTCAGFGSLALTPIPPVRVFGIFVALGVFAAWFFTVTLIPAYISLMSEESLENFGMAHHEGEEDEHPSLLGRALYALGRFTYTQSKLIILGVFILIGISAYGISKININDNPVKWFEPSHEIRVADRELNERFAGTYMAYLELESSKTPLTLNDLSASLSSELASSESAELKSLAPLVAGAAKESSGPADLIERLRDEAIEKQDTASDEEWEAWDEAITFLDSILLRDQTFKDPEVLQFVNKLQDYLINTGLVGKSNSVADIVKTVHRELFLGEAEQYKIPASVAAVGQTLVTFQSGHRPNDLWHFVTPDYRKTSLWVQLKSGDNQDMSALVEAVDKFFLDNPAPESLVHNWYGLTYINVIWQDKMVAGMLEAFLGSFVIVLVLMTILFRSFFWGLLAMIPLTVTIAVIYGTIGLIGKDYDMPVAVLSSLSLGLAVDYAIHFLARSRYLRTKSSSWKETVIAVFGEPARAIARNIIVIGVGFLPLLAAPLLPYKTVGVFISAILLLAGLATLVILPALITIFEKYLFKKENKA